MASSVYAVMTVTVEVHVRSSSPKETLEELERVSIREAAGIIRNSLPNNIVPVGNPVFSHAIVRSDKK